MLQKNAAHAANTDACDGGAMQMQSANACEDAAASLRIEYECVNVLRTWHVPYQVRESLILFCLVLPPARHIQTLIT